MCLCSPMPSDDDLGAAGAPACSRYPDCDARGECGWPAQCPEGRTDE